MMIWSMYLLWNDHHNINTPFNSYYNFLKNVLRTCKIYSLGSFQGYNTASLTMTIMLHVRAPKLYSSYNLKFVPFDQYLLTSTLRSWEPPLYCIFPGGFFFFFLLLTSKKCHTLYAFLTYFTLQVHPCKWQGFILLWLNDRYPVMCVIV